MFSEIFIQRPRLALVISIVTIIAGMMCIFKLPIAEYPEIAPPQVTVRAMYPGASSQVIASTIAAPIETAVNGTEDLLYYSSKSDNNGNYELSLTFKSGINDDIAQVNVQNAVRRAERVLPTETVNMGITIKKQSSDMLGLFIFSSTNPDHTRLYLSNYVSMNVRDAIARVDGVSNASIFGALDYSMRIWLDPVHMSALGVSPEDVQNAIQSQNIQAAAGSVGAEASNDMMQYKINAMGRLDTPEAFAKIIIKTSTDGRQVRISDIARVELGAETYTGNSFYNGKPSVALGLYRISDANAINVVDAVKERVAEIAKSFPDGMSYEMAYDPTLFIRTSIEEITVTLLMTLFLVVGITYVFLQDWRATLIPSVTIPVSLIGTFVFMMAFGLTINVLTLFALILVIGSVVDDAIVVVENTMRLIEEEHLSPREAASKSMRQITGAVIATTLVILAVYAPVGFYGGMVGTIYLQFALTMCIALVLSTVNALTLSPALCSILLRPHQEATGVFKLFNICLDFTKRIYLCFVNFLVRRAFLTLLLFGVVLFFMYTIFERTPTSFIPSEDKGVLFCAVQLPASASLARTDKHLLKFSEDVRKIKGVKNVIAISGFSMIGGNGENVGMAIVALEDWSDRPVPGIIDKIRGNSIEDLSLDAIMQQLKIISMKEASAKIDVFAPPAIMGMGVTGGVSFVLEATGTQTPQELNGTLQRLIGEIRQIPGVIMAFSSYDASTPQLYLNVDRAKAEAMQVPISRIFSTLQSKLASYYINDFNIYGYSYKVKMQADKQYRGTINDIEQIHVRTNTGEMVPLNVLAKAERIVAPRQVDRFNQFMCGDMNVILSAGTSSGEVMKSIQTILYEKFPKDYRLDWTGMSYQERGNEGKLVGLMALALVFGYLFLVGQYESWTVPISVILSVAVAVLGALVGLELWGMSLSIYAQLGLVMLVGMAAKNAILIVEFSKQEREVGVGIFKAAYDGADKRYRAVLMTALSFVIGVFPMVIATGAGAASRQAIGVPTFCGMVVATVIGIIFVPALYAIFQRTREFFTTRRRLMSFRKAKKKNAAKAL